MNTQVDNQYIKRCFELAQLGAKNVSPNPMVGAVIVYKNRIIGEGYHQKSGQAHAEVNAVNSVVNKELLPDSTIYVSLEPCAHYGKTPPCAALIVKHQFKKVVIAAIDPHSKVQGKGIKLITQNAIEVVTLKETPLPARLNKIFNTVHQKKRPFYLLKWAQTKNGFIDAERTQTNQKPLQISNSASSRWVHKIRSEVDGILIGKNTAIYDSPLLTTRKWSGHSPTPILIDPNLNIAIDSPLFKAHKKVIIVNTIKQSQEGAVYYEKVSLNRLKDQLNQLLLNHNLHSILVEGGAHTLSYFISQNLWDMAYCISAPTQIKKGIKAPNISPKKITSSHLIHTNTITIYENN